MPPAHALRLAAVAISSLCIYAFEDGNDAETIWSNPQIRGR